MIRVYRNDSSRRWGYWSFRNRVKGLWFGPLYITWIRSH